jgi:sec-independent protein translocase protein TatA
MGDIGIPELLIILAIIIVLFGANRLKGLGGALGSSIRDFKQALHEEESPGVPTVAKETPDQRQ